MFNWLDIVLLIVLLITLVLGLIKGLVRQLVGILAVIAGLVLGILYYRPVASAFRPLVATDTLAFLLGFLTIFLVVLVAGWLISRLFSKAERGSIKFVNHLLGGVFGLLKGVLICGILIFALLVFPVNLRALQDSLVAPYCVRVTRAAVDLIPQDLKDGFKDAADQIISRGGGHGERI